MSGRGQALNRTRCPACDTIFRVTSEQLRLKAGKVRCGHCQTVFNAFDQLISEPEVVPVAIPQTLEFSQRLEDPSSPWPENDDYPAAPAPAPAPAPENRELAALAPTPIVDAPAAVLDVPFSGETLDFQDRAASFVAEPVQSPVLPSLPQADVAHEAAHLPRPDVPKPTVTPSASAEAADSQVESVEVSTQAARDAGLVAARELIDTQAYNRWAAGTLADSGLSGFASEAVRAPQWPFILGVAALLLALSAQLAYYFRTELVGHFPKLSAVYSVFSVEVPLARISDLVTIETSDLQADNARGLFILNAGLMNHAAFPQAWPVLELTLTDVNERVVSRRLIEPVEYLPPGSNTKLFAANTEQALRLWLAAPGIGAAGYRLYVFYP